MKRRTGFILFSGISLALLISFISFARESEEAQIKAEETEVSIVEPEILWLWGEVTSIDSQSKTFSVKYFDYDTEVEQDIVLNVNDKTTYEGVKGIDEIKVKDAVSVDYMVAGGVSVARNISVEKVGGGVEEEGEEGLPKKKILSEEAQGREAVTEATEAIEE